MEIIRYFPRQVAVPDRITCKNEKEFFNVVNKYNGIKPKIYFSLYNCSEQGSFDGALIDKICFDLDSDNSLDNLKKLHKYCCSKNYKHILIFSSGGFWVYIFATNYTSLKNKKTALANAQRFIAKEVGLSIGKDPHLDDVDFHIVGDIARVARMPNSYDIKRGIYAIPITIEDANQGINFIRQKAKKQNLNYFYYCSKLFDISKFDCAETKPDVDIPDGSYDYSKCEEDVKNFPPCVIDMITNQEVAIWQARWYAALFLKEMGYPKSFTAQLLKKYYSQHLRTDHLKNNWIHFQKTKVLELVYDSNRNDFFPSCKKLFLDGYCKGKCKWFSSQIYK